MARPVKPRSAGEHLSVLARIMRQVDADPKLKSPRARRIKQHLGLAMAEFQALLMGGK